PGVVPATDHELRRAAGRDIRDVDVVADAVAVTAVEGDALAVMRPYRAAVNEVAARDLARRGVRRLHIQLVVLIPFLVLEECGAGAGARRAHPADRVVIERELLARAHGSRDAMHLHAVAETGGDQHAAIGLPVQERRLA